MHRGQSTFLCCLLSIFIGGRGTVYTFACYTHKHTHTHTHTHHLLPTILMGGPGRLYTFTYILYIFTNIYTRMHNCVCVCVCLCGVVCLCVCGHPSLPLPGLFTTRHVAQDQAQDEVSSHDARACWHGIRERERERASERESEFTRNERALS